MAKHPQTVSLKGWSGVNNVLRPERVDPKYLTKALNVDIDKSGGLKKRLGYSLLDSGDYHSLWSEGSNCFAVKGTDLVRIKDDQSVEVLKSNVTSSLSFAEFEGTPYFTGEGQSGIISGSEVREWGIQPPNPRPTLTATTGGMTGGIYQIVLTYVRDDGTESGAGLATSIVLGTSSGITVSGIPTSTDSTVDKVNIYVSTPDGEVLYLDRDYPNGTSSITITSVTNGVLPLPSFNMSPPPKGQIVREAHGRAFVAQDNVLWFSEPYSYHWFNFHKNFFVLPSRIVAVMPVEGGIWVAADRLYYLSGKDTDKMRIELKEPVAAVPGTDVRIPGAYIFIENTPIGYKWLLTTDKGVYICFNDGIALNMTEKNHAFPEADSGAAVFVQRDGINRYLTILDQNKESNNTAVGDLTTASIIRNGVTLEE